MNNADYGLSLQKKICEKYNLDINNQAEAQFNANYNSEYDSELEKVIPVIFEKVNAVPISLLTYTQELTKGRQTTSPHNFMLDNGKTLSIRTTKNSDKEQLDRLVLVYSMNILQIYMAVRLIVRRMSECLFMSIYMKFCPYLLIIYSSLIIRCYFQERIYMMCS